MEEITNQQLALKLRLIGIPESLIPETMDNVRKGQQMYPVGMKTKRAEIWRRQMEKIGL